MHSVFGWVGQRGRETDGAALDRTAEDPNSRDGAAPSRSTLGRWAEVLQPRRQHELCPGEEDAVRRRGVSVQRVQDGEDESHAHRLLRLARGASSLPFERGRSTHPSAGHAQINVFVLGSTYLKLVKELSLQLPSVDPSLYISRFAALLEFGEETQKVAQDAVRLVARMGRDWMHIGRRPAGVCGACLLLAARMNNFRRSITEVVQVVKIADVTLRKRLGEFKDTPSGALTVADFRTLWLDETADPPAFTVSQKREKKERERAEARKKRKEEEGSDFEDNSTFAGSVMGDDGDGERAAFAELAANGSSPVRLGKRKREDDDAEPVASAVPKWPGFEDNDELDKAISTELGQTLDSTTGKALMEELDKKDLARIQQAGSMTNLNTSERLDDLDEDELDCFILTDAEAEAKSRLWMEFNKEYLQALAGAFFPIHLPIVGLVLTISFSVSSDKQTGPDGELRPETKPRIVRSLPVLPLATPQPTDPSLLSLRNSASATSLATRRRRRARTQPMRRSRC